MEYPIFDVPVLGGSLLIAGMAIFHAYIAHFSVGAGFFMAIAERRANREGDAETLAFLKKYAMLVLLAPYVLGTVTGVGIWFTTALASPRAISVLIHQFVWGWATEWVLFIVEVTAIYLYFYTWGRIPPKQHNRIGWIFAVASVLTLAIINGILSFMLTPGGWQPLGPAAFWKGIFNPGYFPTTLIRILIALALAGAGAIAMATFVRGISARTRDRVVALAYRMILPSVLCIPLAVWAFATLTDRARGFLSGGAPVMMLFLAFGLASFAALTLSAVLSVARRDYATSTLGACVLVALAFVSFGSLEFVREGVRKPYLIEGFMYSTGITTAEAAPLDSRATWARVSADGVLSAAPWALPPGERADALGASEKGAAVYKAACLRCHSIDGYNGMRPLVRRLSPDTVRMMLDRIHEVQSAMPAFPGTEDEKAALATFLVSLK